MLSEQERVPYAAGRLSGSPIVVLAPHPDDELFGPGGAVTLAVRSGSDLRVVVVTDGGAQGSPQARREESRRAAARLGWPEPEFWGFEDRSLEHTDDRLGERIVALVERERPELLLVPSPAENHPDHRAVALATWAALRRSPAGVETTLVSYEVSAVLHPNLLVDVSAVWDDLLAAGEAFTSQLEAAPYLEVLDAIATARTLTLGAEVKRAEAYFVADPAWRRQRSLGEWAAHQGPTALLEGVGDENHALRTRAAELERQLDAVHRSRTWRVAARLFGWR